MIEVSFPKPHGGAPLGHGYNTITGQASTDACYGAQVHWSWTHGRYSRSFLASSSSAAVRGVHAHFGLSLQFNELQPAVESLFAPFFPHASERELVTIVFLREPGIRALTQRVANAESCPEAGSDAATFFERCGTHSIAVEARGALMIVTAPLDELDPVERAAFLEALSWDAGPPFTARSGDLALDKASELGLEFDVLAAGLQLPSNSRRLSGAEIRSLLEAYEQRVHRAVDQGDASPEELGVVLDQELYPWSYLDVRSCNPESKIGFSAISCFTRRTERIDVMLQPSPRAISHSEMPLLQTALQVAEHFAFLKEALDQWDRVTIGGTDDNRVQIQAAYDTYANCVEHMAIEIREGCQPTLSTWEALSCTSCELPAECEYLSLKALAEDAPDVVLDGLE